MQKFFLYSTAFLLAMIGSFTYPSSEYDIVHAIADKNIDKVKSYLERNPDPNLTFGSTKNSAIMVALGQLAENIRKNGKHQEHSFFDTWWQAGLGVTMASTALLTVYMLHKKIELQKPTAENQPLQNGQQLQDGIVERAVNVVVNRLDLQKDSADSVVTTFKTVGTAIKYGGITVSVVTALHGIQKAVTGILKIKKSIMHYLNFYHEREALKQIIYLLLRQSHLDLSLKNYQGQTALDMVHELMIEFMHDHDVYLFLVDIEQLIKNRQEISY